MRKWFLLMAYAVLPISASAHIGPKEVQSIERPQNRPGEQWVVVNNLGLFQRSESETSWICDEAMTPFPGLTAVVPMGVNGDTWLVGTRSGLRRTLDGGCNFLEPQPPLDTHVVADISAHPGRPEEALLSTQTLGQTNDLYLTEDSGESWTALNLEITGRIRAFLRAPNSPERIYLVHAGGGLVSRDGGRSFTRFQMGPPELEIGGTEFDLLGVHPDDPDTLFAAYATFPEAQLLKSEDGGSTWVSMLAIPDIPDSIALRSQGQTLLISTPVLGLLKSPDAGGTWEMIDSPLEMGSIGCLTVDSDESLVACAQRNETSLLLRSNDFGLSWTTVIDLDLTGVTRKTSCAAGSDTTQLCSYTCDEFPETCPMRDGSLDEMSDAGVDAFQTDADGAVSGGCMAASSAPRTAILWLGAGALLLYSRRRRTPFPDGQQHVLRE